MSAEQKRLLESDGTLPDELADFPITEPITLKACGNCVAWDPKHEMIAKTPDLGMCMAQPVVHFTRENGETGGFRRFSYNDRWCELHEFTAPQKPKRPEIHIELEGIGEVSPNPCRLVRFLWWTGLLRR